MAGKTREPLTLPTAAQVNEERSRLQRRSARWKLLRTVLGTVLVIAAAAVLISNLLIPVAQVSGSSMEPTLKDRDIVLLLKVADIEAGDICAFSYNNKTLIKRVIAGPGDYVNMNMEGTVFVNGKELSEPYISSKSLGFSDTDFPIQLEEDQWFVLGDNRASSLDSRNSQIGLINSEQIIGRVILRIWPLSRIK